MGDLKWTANPPRIITLITEARGQVILAVLAFILIIVFSASVFIYQPFDGITLLTELKGVVTDIYHPGPGDRAGFKVGDQILSVNGRPVDPYMRRPIYPAGLRAGDKVVYQILRSGKSMTLTLTLGSYWVYPSPLAGIVGTIVLSVFFWVLGWLLCLFAPIHDIRARLIGVCWLLASIAAAAGGPGTQSHFWGSSTSLKVGWALLGFTLVAAHLYFPLQILSSKRRSLLINLLAVIACLIALFAVIDDAFLKSVGISLADLGLSFTRVVYAWFLGAVLISIILLLRNQFRSQEAEAKRQTGIILWAMVLGFGPFFILTLIPLVVFGERAHEADGSYTSLFLALIPLAYAYVINQRRLLRIDAILNRLVVLFVLMLSVLIATFAVLGTLAILLKLPPQIPLVGSLAASVVALPSAMFEKKIQEKVNRILYGTYYDHATITTGLSGELARAIDRKTLTDLLTRRLCTQMGIQQAALYLVDGMGLNLQGSSHNPPILPLDDAFTRTISDSNQPIRSQNLWALLSEEAQARWSDLGWGQVFIPIVFEKNIVALLILGGRPSGDIYSAQDIAILGTVADQAALAVDNIQLVDSLHLLNRSLVQAEDDRRKNIASELHDTILQDLYLIRLKVSHLKTTDEITDLFDQVIQRLRVTIQQQRPNLLNSGLPLALKGLVDEMNNIAGEEGPHITWHSGLKNGLNVTDPLATSVYRIAQEAITNAVKHADAYQVDVTLDYLQDNILQLCVCDDGVGLKDSKPNRQGNEAHFGMELMRERAEMINGQLEIESTFDQGTLVKLSIHL